MLSINLFGSPHFYLDDRAVNITRHKAMALLAYMSIVRQPYGRTALAAMLFPEKDHVSALAYLRRMLYELKTAVGDEYFAILPKTIALESTSALWVDVHEFCRLLHPCRSHTHDKTAVCSDCGPQLETAIKLYRGDFLQGFAVKDAPDFDEWQTWQAHRFKREMIHALTRLADYYHQQHDLDTAVERAQQILSLDSVDESTHRRLIAWYAAMGRHTDACRQYEMCVSLLAEKLDVAPQLETTRLIEQIRHPVWQNGNSSQTLFKLETQSRDNLPPQLSFFMGREVELQEIQERFDRPACRLITILGPGGMGKTQLALEYGRRQKGSFSHGVFFVSLAELDSPDYLPSAIASAIGFTFIGRQEPKEQILNYLQNKEMLLILDNFEHLTLGSKLLLGILQTAPSIKLLVTSRHSLDLKSEWLYDIEGLTYPANGDLTDITKYGAIQLFSEQVYRVKRHYAFTQSEQMAAAQICQLVEGMPLGIELAASMTRVFSCKDIATQIEERIDFLNSYMLDVPARHQNLRAIFDLSWHLLSQEEKELLSKLSVFQGSFSQQAAENICEASLNLLWSLCDKSFLTQEGGGRYKLHQIHNTFAAEKLATFPDIRELTLRSYSAYFINFLCNHESDLSGARQRQSLSEISEDMPNIRKAWAWGIQNASEDLLIKSTLTLSRYYKYRGLFQEGKDIFAASIENLFDSDAPLQYLPAIRQLLKGQLVGMFGTFCFHLSQYEIAEKSLLKSVEILFSLGKEEFAANSLLTLGGMSVQLGQHQKAAQQLHTAYDIATKQRNLDIISGVHSNLGVSAAMQGNYDEAEVEMQKALELAKITGNQFGQSLLYTNLGIVFKRLGRLEMAKECLKKSLEISQQMKLLEGSINSISLFGSIEFALGNYSSARDYFQHYLFASEDLNNLFGVALAKSDIGFCDFRLSLIKEAAQHLLESLTIAFQINLPPIMLQNIIRFALILERENCLEMALGLLFFAREHEATDANVKKEMEPTFSKLKNTLLPDTVEKIQEISKKWSLEEVVSDILENQGNPLLLEVQLAPLCTK